MQANLRVTRNYYNSSGALLRSDAICVTGALVRTKQWTLGSLDQDNTAGRPTIDFGDFRLHTNKTVSITLFESTAGGSRVVSYITSAGPVDATGTEFTWTVGTVDQVVSISELPDAGDAV